MNRIKHLARSCLSCDRRLPTACLIGLLAVFLLGGVIGCGTNFNELLYNSLTALGRSYVDVALTDFANDSADRQEPAEEPDDGAEDDDNGDGGNGAAEKPPLEELTGDAGAGEAVYAAENCAACHCPDASGGCALSAPALVGASAGTLDEFLRGAPAHAGIKPALSNQEIVDLAAYLAELGG